MIVCSVEGCENEAAWTYAWAWGEEGACCAAHRSLIESQSVNLGRGVIFTSIDNDTNPGKKKSYSAPQIVALAPELGAAKMKIAEQQVQIQDLEQKNEELKAQIRVLHRTTPAAEPPKADDVEVTYTPPHKSSHPKR